MNRHDITRESLRRARRWIAGTNRHEALAYAKSLSDQGIIPVLNFLGEQITNKQEIDHNLSEIIMLMNEIGRSGIRANISVKPSSLGQLISLDLLKRNIISIVSRLPVGIEIIMDAEMPELLLGAYEVASKIFELGYKLRVTIPCAYPDLIRGEVKELAALEASFRIVKGAYGVSTISMQCLMERIIKVKRIARRSILATNSVALLKMLEEAHYLCSFEGVETLLGKHIPAERYARSLGLNIYRYMPYGYRWLDYCSRRDNFFKMNYDSLKSRLDLYKCKDSDLP